MEENAEETDVLRKELQWLLDDQVHQVLHEIYRTLVECSRRFPSRTPPEFQLEDMEARISVVNLTDPTTVLVSFTLTSQYRGSRTDEDSLVKPQRILMSSPNGSGQIKCMVTLQGDRICDADITFKHKQGKDHHMYKTGLTQGRIWRLQQLQDASNFLFAALNAVQVVEKNHIFKSAKEVIMILDNVMSNLTQGRSCLSFPKRKSIEELLNNANMQMLNPTVPNNVALSFYIHSSKLILALYHLHKNGKQRIDITSRHQVESSVQWLNEAVILFTVALQHCQQLKDKFVVLQQYEEVL